MNCRWRLWLATTKQRAYSHGAASGQHTRMSMTMNINLMHPNIYSSSPKT